MPLHQRLIALLSLVAFLWLDLWLVVSPSHAFSIKEEREYGQKMLAVIRSQFQLLDEPDINQYINKLGQDIIKIAGGQYFEYHFYVIDNKDFNAFAAPSGLIFMHSGLLEAMDNEDQLLSVLAHEVGHVTSRHIAGRLEQSTKINAATLAMMLAGIALGGGALSQALITGGLATGQAMSMAFSRQDEEEADRKGYEYMLAMERDPHDMVAMLHKMYKVQQLNLGRVPQYMLTHPNPDIRMGYVEDLIHTKPPVSIRKVEPFAFSRIKCRVKSYTREPGKLKGSYRKQVRQAKGSFARHMARYGLSLAYAAEARWPEAEKELATVIKAFPGQAILKTDLGVYYLRQGKAKQALAILLEARQMDPSCWYNSYYLAQALVQNGSEHRALSLFQQVAGLMPDFPGAYYHMAAILARQNRHGEAYYYLGKNFFYLGKFITTKYHFKNARKLLAHDKQKMADMDAIEKLIKEFD